MTSTTAIEIIDLTDIPHSSDDDIRKIPSTADHGIDVDPAKSTSRAVRKRKNGEPGTSRNYPVELRGDSVERDHTQLGGGTESQLTEDARGRKGESTKKKKRRSKKSKDEDKDNDSMPSSLEGTQHDGQLFFVDTIPALVAADMAFNSARGARTAQSTSQATATDTPPLLLPAHVSILDPGDDLPVQIVRPTDSDSGSESYIEYLTYDDRLAPDMVRYFEAPTGEQKQTRFVCKRCGAESEHRTNECPVQICLTCGARDEHSTRSCPISKTCFTCGMKGHINKNCPNRHSRDMVNNYDDCDRCGSDKHNTNECPTIWRLYEYVAEDERGAILRLRESKQSLALGQGGEGYIARDEWCHNCGNSGHLGDDCRELPRPHDTPSAPSAFGLYNTLSGPFSDAAAGPVHVRAPREWENGNNFADGWGASAPINVGKRARNRERVRMEQRALELQEQDDQGDWFENARNMRNRGARRDTHGGGGGGGGGASTGGHGSGKKDAKIRIGRAWKSDDPPHRKPSLLERVVGPDEDEDDYHHSRNRRHYDSHSRDRQRDRDRDRDRASDWERRSRDRDRNWDRDRDRYGGSGGGDGGDSGELRIRGSAGRSDSSRHADSGVHERERHRRGESRNGDRRWEDRNRERETRSSRDDRGPRGPQYKGGYAR